MKRLLFLFLGWAAVTPVMHAQSVTFESLLNEMTSREVITRTPDPGYRTLQASSYDRRTKSPKKHWFANGDRSYFIRVDQREGGQQEHVMMESEGPGAIVRFWAVTSKPHLLEGTLRIYLDDRVQPVFSGTLEEMIGGDFFVGAPLSECLSPQTKPHFKRGRNLYLPIPFASYCKVTYEKTDGKLLIAGERAWPNDAVFYNINYRLYDKETEVKSLSAKQLQDARARIKTAQTLLRSCAANRGVDSTNTDLRGALKPGATNTITLNAPSPEGGSIRGLKFKLDAGSLPQALRSTVLEIAFDGEKTVWCPVGDFFGTGYQIRESKHWYGSVSSDGLMECHWVMPFQKQCEVSLHNLGDQPVRIIQADVSLGKTKWDEGSMYFGSAWRQYTAIRSKPDRDLNYVTLTGQGVYVGDSLTLFDTSPKWWGEGDEKIFVDGESFPSHFGTGTEDYYGYAWCMTPKFSAPFVTQPDGSGNEGVGFTVNSRYRSLDGIPFKKNLRFDMELMHWAKSVLHYAPTVYWYAKPGIDVNTDKKNNVQHARHPVALSPEDVVPIQP